MTNPVVTDEMVEAAWKVYAASPVENGWKSAMRYALIAALDASSYNPTPEAYEAARKALWKHREENERLRTALQEVFEMWAGSEGFIPETAPEGYLLELIKRMAVRASTALEGSTV